MCVLVVCALFIAVSFSSCSDDDDEGGNVPSGFYGIYCNNYQNRIFRYYSFYEDGTGLYTFDGNVSHSEGEFTYSFRGDKVTCKGTYVSGWSDGSVNAGDINVTFTYTDGRLVTDGGDVYEKID